MSMRSFLSEEGHHSSSGPVQCFTDAGFSGGADNFYAYTAGDCQTYDMFEIRKMHFDASHHVYAVTGSFERIAYDDEIPFGETAENGRMFTYNLSADFTARMFRNNHEQMTETIVSDLYEWYVNVYMEGVAPQGDMHFLYDLPEAERAEASVDFWFVTTRIHLNNQNEIDYMEYVYVPWG